MTTMTNAHESEGSLPAACARLDRELADFLDGTLDGERSEWVAEHLSECARCAAALESLGAPGELGRAVAALPSIEAPRHLWDGVAARIAAPVVEIGTARGVSRGSRAGWWRSGVAAAGLVLATAGVTYTLTARQQRPTSGAAQVASAQAPTTQPTVQSTTPPSPDTLPNANPTTTPNPTPIATSSGVRTVANRSTAGARRITALPADPARDTYDREIAKLRVVLQQRRGDLDTSTVRVVTQSLKVIDQAIAQSKAALAKDPASGFLNKQLNNALDQKLELLRTAALLPART